MTGDGVWLNCYFEFHGAVTIKEGQLGTYGVHLLKPELQKKMSKFSKVLNSSTQFVGSKRKPNIEVEVPTELYSEVYHSLLNAWTLSPEHLRHLVEARCLPANEIERLLYRTSNANTEIIKTLFTKYGSRLLHVPGFYQTGSQIKFCSNGQLVIPTRTIKDEIVNLRIRVSDEDQRKNPSGLRYFYASSSKFGGPKAVLSHHFVQCIKPQKENVVWITEGEIKAHVISVKLGVDTISIPGVTLWREALEPLKVIGAKGVVLAFDSDAATNSNVARALIQLHNELKRGKYNVEFAKW